MDRISANSMTRSTLFMDGTMPLSPSSGYEGLARILEIILFNTDRPTGCSARGSIDRIRIDRLADRSDRFLVI